MKIFFILLSLLVFLYFEKYVLKENVNGKGVLLFIGIEILSSVYITNSRFYSMIMMFTFLVCLLIQDVKTYYISRWWILPGLFILFIFYGRYSIVSACLFGIPSLALHLVKKDWIGSADVCMMFYFGLILGIERMFVCMFIAIFSGFLFLIFSKDKFVPFVSCLCIGAWIALIKGYSIWFLIYDILIL